MSILIRFLKANKGGTSETLRSGRCGSVEMEMSFTSVCILPRFNTCSKLQVAHKQTLDDSETTSRTFLAYLVKVSFHCIANLSLPLFIRVIDGKVLSIDFKRTNRQHEKDT